MHDFVRDTWFGLLFEKVAPELYGALRRRFRPAMRAVMFRTVFCLTVSWIVGAVIGWYSHAASTSASEASKPCREEVISVDGARGPVSCTNAEHVGELKDGYLVCKCKTKK